jgi:hypothetical protein
VDEQDSHRNPPLIAAPVILPDMDARVVRPDELSGKKPAQSELALRLRHHGLGTLGGRDVIDPRRGE